jgi:nucleoside-diphosphate-sugar epimerase
VLPDLLDEARLAPAFHGADALVHLAGRAHVTGARAREGEAAFHAVNVLPTIACTRAATRAGIRTFVLMSSVAAVGGNDEGTISDATPLRPVNAYGRSKLEAERALAALVPSSMRAVSLRPPMVYGPGMPGNPLRLFRLVDSGLPLPVGSLHNARTVLYVDNLARMVVRVLEHDSPGPPASYLVGDPETVSTVDLVRRIADALGRPARVIDVPRSLLEVVARAGDVLSRILPVPFDSRTLGSLAGTLVLDSSAFCREFGDVRVVPLEDAIRETAAWFSATSATRRVPR